MPKPIVAGLISLRPPNSKPLLRGGLLPILDRAAYEAPIGRRQRPSTASTSGQEPAIELVGTQHSIDD